MTPHIVFDLPSPIWGFGGSSWGRSASHCFFICTLLTFFIYLQPETWNGGDFSTLWFAGGVGGLGQFHSILHPCVPISSPFIPMAYLLPFFELFCKLIFVSIVIYIAPAASPTCTRWQLLLEKSLLLSSGKSWSRFLSEIKLLCLFRSFQLDCSRRCTFLYRQSLGGSESFR